MSLHPIAAHTLTFIELEQILDYMHACNPAGTARACLAMYFFNTPEFWLIALSMIGTIPSATSHDPWLAAVSQTVYYILYKYNLVQALRFSVAIVVPSPQRAWSLQTCH